MFADMGEDEAGELAAAAVFYRQSPNPHNPHGTLAHVLNVYVVSAARRRGAGRPVYERLGFAPSGGMRLNLPR